MNALSDKEKEALRQLVSREPFRWKKWLRGLWERAVIPAGSPEFFTTVYALRNSHGPSWLVKVRAQDFAEPMISVKFRSLEIEIETDGAGGIISSKLISSERG